MTTTSAIESVLVGVTDMAEALGLFETTMGLTREAEYAISPSLAAAWSLGAGVTGRIVELSCAGHPYGRMRLAEFSPTPDTKVRRHAGPGPHDSALDIGPKAIDFYIEKPAMTAYEKVTGAGYPSRSKPILHEVGGLTSEEFVFWGPDGVPLLCMVGHNHSPADMRGEALKANAFSEVATISVVGAKADETRRFYADALGLETRTDAETEPEFLDAVNELTGTPPGTPIKWLLFGGEGEPSGKILVVHFGDGLGTRLHGRMRPGHLGFSLMRHRHGDLDALQARIAAAGFSITLPPTDVEVNGRSERIMLAAGPNEELFEFVEQEP